MALSCQCLVLIFRGYRPNVMPMAMGKLGVFQPLLALRANEKFRPQRRQFSSADTLGDVPVLHGTEDRFNGTRINMEEQFKQNTILKSMAHLKRSLQRTISQSRLDQRTALWLDIPSHLGYMIPEASKLGFVFHHAEGNYATMCLWLADWENRIPEYATHQIGVAGLVLNEETKQVLMIQDKHRVVRWKFPGGYSKLGEDFSETATREVLEETGIKTEFQSILAFRQQHDMVNGFGRSDIYVVCRLRPVTFDLRICRTELLAAEWMDLDEILSSGEHTALTSEVARLARRGLERGFDDVDIRMKELQSIYKGKTYNLFSRPPVEES